MSLLWKAPLVTVLVVMTLGLIYLCLLNPLFLFVVGFIVVLIVAIALCGNGIKDAIKEEWKDE